MKNIIDAFIFITAKIFIVALLLFLGLCTGCKKNNNYNLISHAESGFVTLPDSIQTSVYWYWISDNLSKEGIVKDLHAMKQQGINRAFIGNIFISQNKSGNIKLLSDDWWEVLHTALKTATELNIDIGIFNGPGWSQSGGPWVDNEQAMRYLNIKKFELVGPMSFDEKLSVSNKDFQLLHTIAYKISDDSSSGIQNLPVTITANPLVDNIEFLNDKNEETGIELQVGQELVLDFATDSAATVRSLMVQTLNHRMTIANAEVFVKENQEFKSIKKFKIDRSNFSPAVGFNPNAPIVVSLPEINSSHFRLVLSDIITQGKITEVQFSSLPKVERYSEKSLAKMAQIPMPLWHDYLWERQPEVTDTLLLIEPSQIIDLTSNVSEMGTLKWDIPEGRWKIMQAGLTPTEVTNQPASAEGTGLEVDKMNKEHVRSFFDSFMGEIIRRIPPEDRKSWKVVVADSYETGGQNWTDDMADEFMDTYGYNPLPYLPVLKGYVVGSQDHSDRFLWDLRRLVADKVAYDYVGGLREICHENGLTLWLENYGHWGFPSEFLKYGGQSDEVSGEFWVGNDLGSIENKAASSCAHIYGKRKVSAESFTSAGTSFANYPAMMKQRADKFFAEGVNNTLLHVYIHQPNDNTPGLNTWFGTEFNRNNTWFEYSYTFLEYIKRTNFILQHGLYVADVAYFIGENTPIMTGDLNPALPEGYSYDFINAEVIQTRLSVKNNRLVLPDGMSYKLLILPDLDTMRPELLRTIKKLIEQGAFVLGNAPNLSPSLTNYPEADVEVKLLADQIWGRIKQGENKAKIGKGMIFTNTDLDEVLNYLELPPDFKVDNSKIVFTHRRLKDADVYFLANQSDEELEIYPEFRITGKAPELWNPVNGDIRKLPAFTQKEQTTVVPMKLAPSESQFVVFRNKNRQAVYHSITDNFPNQTLIASLNNSWSVKFDDSIGNFSGPIHFDKLESWTLSDREDIKYYSGKAIYQTKVELENIKNGNEIFLDLGDVMVMAEVYVNGQNIGGLWTPPYQINITEAIHVGENEIEILVVNNWLNKLVGDLVFEQEDESEKVDVKFYDKNTPLQTSGLLGPVQLIEYQYQN